MQENDSSAEEFSQNSEDEEFFQKAAARDVDSEEESDEKPALV